MNWPLRRQPAPMYKITEGIPVTIEVFTDGFLVGFREGNAWGAGKTVQKAMDDFREEAVALFEMLAEDEHELGPGLLKELHALAPYMEKA